MPVKNRKLHKRYFVPSLLCVILVVLGASCLKKPHWQTNVTIPLVSKSYSILDRLDTTLFRVNSDSSIQFFISGRLDTFALLDSVQIQNHGDTLETKLSDFVFNNLATSSIGLSPEEITGLPLPDSTIHIPIPAFSRDVDKNLIFNNIGMASIRTGFLQVRITNGSRIPFDSINCSLSNLLLIHLQNIDSLSTIEFSQHLYNVSIESVASFHIFFASSGTGFDSIPISRHDSIKFFITFDSLRIDTCCFRSIPPRLVNSVKKRIYSLPSNYQIRISNLIFQDGQLTVNLNNQFPLDAVLQCSIPELSFDTSLQLPALNSINFGINLASRNYHNSSDSLTPVTLKTVSQFTLDSTFIYLGQGNSITVSYLINSIQIDSIAGTIIDTIQHRLTADSIHISLPDFLQRVEAVNAYAMLDITNAVAFPINIELTASAISSSGSVAVDTTFSISPGTPVFPEITTIVLNFTPLFNVHPEYVLLNVDISAIGAGWMSQASYNTASYTITTPLQVILRADTINFSPSTVHISEKIRNVVRDYGDSSIFHAHIQNHFPARMAGDIILQNPIFDTVNIRLMIPSGIIDNNGLVITPADTDIAIPLNNLETRIFTDSVIKVSVILYIPNTSSITVSGRDYFKVVNSYAQIQTKMIPKN